MHSYYQAKAKEHPPSFDPSTYRNSQCVPKSAQLGGRCFASDVTRQPVAARPVPERNWTIRKRVLLVRPVRNSAVWRVPQPVGMRPCNTTTLH